MFWRKIVYIKTNHDILHYNDNFSRTLFNVNGKNKTWKLALDSWNLKFELYSVALEPVNFLNTLFLDCPWIKPKFLNIMYEASHSHALRSLNHSPTMVLCKPCTLGQLLSSDLASVLPLSSFLPYALWLVLHNKFKCGNFIKPSHLSSQCRGRGFVGTWSNKVFSCMWNLKPLETAWIGAHPDHSYFSILTLTMEGRVAK